MSQKKKEEKKLILFNLKARAKTFIQNIAHENRFKEMSNHYSRKQ
jgi:hypothetical protein